MGNALFGDAPPPPPPVVLVPPLFDFPPLSARNRMLESSYNLMFGKLALRCLFEDYFEEAMHFTTKIMLRPIDAPHVDMVASVEGPFDHIPGADEELVGKAQFRWRRDVEDPNNFVDVLVSNSDPILLMRSSAHFPESGFGVFGILPVLPNERLSSDGVMGLRYGSSKLSFGATVSPFYPAEEFPKTAWLVSKMGRLTAGVQYEPQSGSKDISRFNNLVNWSYAIGYGGGYGSPLSPSFNFGVEFSKNSQFIASFYQHMVVQRRVKNPLEDDEVVGITNYIDFGFELQARVDGKNTPKDSTFQVAASWQANKNFLLKGKVGPLSSSVALAFKSWWKPSFTFNISAKNDHTKGKTSFGFGISFDSIREGSYQRADPNYVMLTPTKEHLAEGIHWKTGTRPVLESDINSGNFEGIPRELRPLDKIL